MKQEVLYPMSISGDFEQTALVRELLIDEGEMVNDFQGNRVAASDFSQRYSVFVTPTLLFLDNHGEEAARADTRHQHHGLPAVLYPQRGGNRR